MSDDDMPAEPLSVEAAVDALVTAGVLGERQAECWVRRKVEAEPVWAIAEDLDIAESTVYNSASDAQERIDEARATVRAANRIRGFDPNVVELDG